MDQQYYWDFVIDCENGDFTRHLNQGKPEKWRQLADLPWWFTPESIKKDCSQIYSLKESKFYKYQQKGIKEKG